MNKDAHYKIGLGITDLIMWMKVLNCIIPNFDVEKKYSVDAGLPVTEASFQDCMEKLIHIAHDLSVNNEALHNY